MRASVVWKCSWPLLTFFFKIFIFSLLTFDGFKITEIKGDWSRHKAWRWRAGRRPLKVVSRLCFSHREAMGSVCRGWWGQVVLWRGHWGCIMEIGLPTMLPQKSDYFLPMGLLPVLWHGRGQSAELGSSQGPGRSETRDSGQLWPGLNLAIRSLWSEPQSPPGLVFTDCIELLHLWLQRI